jgi:translocation and assembly module TamA
VEGGHTSVKDFDNLPATLRFYAGGDQSVRGYAYNSLGPLDSLGSVAGGKYLLVGSIEYEHRLFEKWSAATFYDVGNAYNSSSEDFKEGAGVGLRWRSPIGPLRVDVSWALSLEEHPWRFHLVVGPDL